VHSICVCFVCRLTSDFDVANDDDADVVRSARYGRLRLNRCAAKSYGNLGCGADVTAMFAGICSARRSCRVAVISLHGIRTTCPSDLKAYVELTYDCVKGSSFGAKYENTKIMQIKVIR